MLGFQLSTLKKTTTYQPDSKRDNKMRHTRDFFLKGVVLLFLIILFAIMTNAKSLEKDDPDGNDLKKEITKHEHLTNTLCAHVNEQCADALFVLASLYYDQALDRYIKAREEYAKSMDDKGIPPRNKEAVNPIPDYTESMEIYAKLIREYSDFKDIDEAYYQVGTIYLLKGDIDSSRWAFKKVLDKAPESRRASAAHFRLADFSIMEHDYPGAFKHLESCKKEGLTQNNLEMVQYRKGEICFNLGEFEKAVEYFFGYIEKCDIGEYRKCEFRQEALEFMAVAFSDMPKGAEAAIVFFNKMGGRSYEDYILYTIGLKNKAHGQTKEAIAAFQKALKKYPHYKDAPLARQILDEYGASEKNHAKIKDDMGMDEIPKGTGTSNSNGTGSVAQGKSSKTIIATTSQKNESDDRFINTTMQTAKGSVHLDSSNVGEGNKTVSATHISVIVVIKNPDSTYDVNENSDIKLVRKGFNELPFEGILIAKEGLPKTIGKTGNSSTMIYSAGPNEFIKREDFNLGSFYASDNDQNPINLVNPSGKMKHINPGGTIAIPCGKGVRLKINKNGWQAFGYVPLNLDFRSRQASRYNSKGQLELVLLFKADSTSLSGNLSVNFFGKLLPARIIKR